MLRIENKDILFSCDHNHLLLRWRLEGPQQRLRTAPGIKKTQNALGYSCFFWLSPGIPDTNGY